LSRDRSSPQCRCEDRQLLASATRFAATTRPVIAELGQVRLYTGSALDRTARENRLIQHGRKIKKALRCLGKKRDGSSNASFVAQYLAMPLIIREEDLCIGIARLEKLRVLDRSSSSCISLGAHRADATHSRLRKAYPLDPRIAINQKFALDKSSSSADLYKSSYDM
jgi:hypothetical protein